MLPITAAFLRAVAVGSGISVATSLRHHSQRQPTASRGRHGVREARHARPSLRCRNRARSPAWLGREVGGAPGSGTLCSTAGGEFMPWKSLPVVAAPAVCGLLQLVQIGQAAEPVTAL